MKLIFLVGLLVAAGVLDFISTMIGLRLGLTETHPWFLTYPFMGTAAALAGVLLIKRLPGSSIKCVREICMGWIVFMCFLPVINNVMVILKVIL